MFSATTVKEAINSKFNIWLADYMLLHDFFRLIVTLAMVYGQLEGQVSLMIFFESVVWKMLEYPETLFALDIQQSLRRFGSLKSVNKLLLYQICKQICFLVNMLVLAKCSNLGV